MIEIHQGEVQLSHTFNDVYSQLNRVGYIETETSVGTNFKAVSAITRDGRPVIRFFQKGKEYARAYECCWGHYYNCNRTRFGMYAMALDKILKFNDAE